MTDRQHDFDFIFGEWSVHHRRLREALSNNPEWVEFDGTCVGRPVWGGIGNTDEIDAPDTPWGHIQGMTVRLFDPKAQQWAIYWANRLTGRMEVPMIGSFTNGVGEFYDQELFRGRAIFSRFIWSNISATTARWEQAFSADGAKTWETNWIMDFRR